MENIIAAIITAGGAIVAALIAKRGRGPRREGEEVRPGRWIWWTIAAVLGIVCIIFIAKLMQPEPIFLPPPGGFPPHELPPPWELPPPPRRLP